MARRRERNPLELIKSLKAGETVGGCLSIEDRRTCVELLVIEGLSVPEIASVIGMSGSTVKGDIQAIRAANALHPSPEVYGEVLGQYNVQMNAVVARLTRLARDPSASVAERVHANGMIMHVVGRFIDRLGRLGYRGGSNDSEPAMRDITELVQIARVIESDPNSDSQLMSEVRTLIVQATKSIGHPAVPKGAT